MAGPTEPIPRPEPLRASVHRRVVQLVTEGELSPGQTLTEAGLSKSLGVSRTPVREALLQLETEGVLRATPARGFTVRELSLTEASELYPILAILETSAVRTSSPRPDLPGLREVDAQLNAAEDPVARWRLDTAFHDKLVQRCPNASLRTMITRLRVIISRYEIEYPRRTGARHTDETRRADILTALAAGDLAGAGEAVTGTWQDRLDAVRGWLTAGAPRPAGGNVRTVPRRSTPGELSAEGAIPASGD